MADQRLLMKSGDKEIVIAVRHSTEWRSAQDVSNDIGNFLLSLPSDSQIQIEYEHDRWYCDPILIANKE